MMRILIFLATVVFSRKSRRRYREEKLLADLQDLLDELEIGVGDFEEQVGDLESFDSNRRDYIEVALADEGPDEFYEEIPTPEELAVGDWLDSDDSEDFYDSDEIAVGDSFEILYQQAIREMGLPILDSDDSWELEVGDSDLYAFGHDGDSDFSGEVAVGDSDEFYEEIPTPGEEYAVGDQYMGETVDEDEVPVDSAMLEEAVGDIYEGEDMDLFDDPDEVPVASHGFDFFARRRFV